MWPVATAPRRLAPSGRPAKVVVITPRHHTHCTSIHGTKSTPVAAGDPLSCETSPCKGVFRGFAAARRKPGASNGMFVRAA